ncbi:hypothetical protein O7626_03790 [Micromonospora sp. WMMD1102]|uniref:hypothetical protein n=1 Tax=Micromonospora sp. WMMD1102 TaxID=3016105 RepID=UPI00241550C3|nr:hypothetical protein [Micromonospora sp. WMMD1102]MDG4785063.1 hypothetical protein [Micromonospora sp. WMMD1102]
MVNSLDARSLLPAVNASSWFARLTPELPKYELAVDVAGPATATAWCGQWRADGVARSLPH